LLISLPGRPAISAASARLPVRYRDRGGRKRKAVVAMSGFSSSPPPDGPSDYIPPGGPSGYIPPGGPGTFGGPGGQPGFGSPGFGSPGGPAGYIPPGNPAGYGPRGPSDDRTWSLLAYLLTFVASILAPLVIYLIKMNESGYVRYHAAQSLNMGLTALIYGVAAFGLGIPLAILTHGLALVLIVPLFIGFTIAHLVFVILAAIAANRGELYRVPPMLCLPMVH
jgi:uncharacterized Tic20 family protein